MLPFSSSPPSFFKSFINSTSKLPPGPLALPVIGHLHLLGPLIHKTFHHLSSRYGPLIYLRIGSVPCVVASSPELAKEFLKTNELTFSARKHTFAIDHLTYHSSFAFAPYGPYWKFIKKLSAYELLGSRTLNQFLPIRTQELNHFIAILLQKSKSGESVNLTQELLKLTNNVISQMMMSLRCSGIADQADGVRTLVREDFLTAATDTTAIALEWALAELINHPEVLEKAQKEIDKVVGKNRLVEESDNPSLHYIHAVIKETFRLHPPIPMISRKSTQECKIGGYTIPEGALLFVNIWSIGRDPKVWEDPFKFRPERFLKSENGEASGTTIDVKGLHYQLLPFGSGRRACPGISLAMQELPTALAAMIQCFDWKVVVTDGEKHGPVDVVDMDERPGLTAPRAHDLECFPISRLGSVPSGFIEAHARACLGFRPQGQGCQDQDKK
ncbi:hypothetical protein SLEP1_g20715 [Rubroshorea leprosula]|uniref:Flavone synthase II n=1 Tax=Rubroshorea leprosula TaxID=152421 RepID=A0AAV5J3L0_9ROSI|nr:hypothetical protein SLEP1_g20715 [Rubroshorea leprosula]